MEQDELPQRHELAVTPEIIEEMSLGDPRLDTVDLFICQNPALFDAFCKRAIEEITEHGKKTTGLVILSLCRTRDGHQISNSYAPALARGFRRKYPEHKDFMPVRPSKFDRNE